MRTPLLLILLVILVAGCGGTSGRISRAAVENRCYALDTASGGTGEDSMGGSDCDFSDQDAICRDYGYTVRQNYENLDKCLEACDEIKSKHWLKHANDGCLNVVLYTEHLCKRYCRQQY